MSERIECPGCQKSLAPTTSGRYRKHGGGDCDYSGTVIPKEDEWNESRSSVTSETASSVTPPEDAARENASPATSSTPSSPSSPDSGAAATTASVQDVVPGIDSYAKELGDLAQTQLTEYRERVEANLKTPFSQPANDQVEQPSLFSQPAGRRSEQPPVPMSAEAGEIAARLKELFYAYDNRKSADNRSAQTTMGPSEMGTPCDRRLALSLMRMPPVNPGGDGWAAFVGTCIHAGLEEMFLWADAGTGRFAVEQRLDFGHPIVPKGTADLLDRYLLMVLDHKCQGRWSRGKLKSQGPIPTYRVQAHVYAYGMRLKGEKIEKIAIVSWPRDESTLDDLYVHVEDYNPDIVRKAFERVDRIHAAVEAKRAELHDTYPVSVEPSEELELEVGARVATEFTVADDCRFCPFYLPNTRDPLRGCNGKQ